MFSMRVSFVEHPIHRPIPEESEKAQSSYERRESHCFGRAESLERFETERQAESDENDT
jgi:hypothetical protein